MSAFRHHLLFRIPVVALLLAMWIILTNHCALGLMEPTADAARISGDCCGGKTNPIQGAPDGLRACCNIKVTMAPAESVVKFGASTFEVQVFAPAQASAAHQVELLRAQLVSDHGPPGFISFAESVLQRSLPSHVPPFVL